MTHISYYRREIRNLFVAVGDSEAFNSLLASLDAWKGVGLGNLILIRVGNVI